MKNFTRLFFLVFVLFSFFRCNEENAGPNEASFEAELLDQFEKNSVLLDTAFSLTADVIEKEGGIQKLIKGSATEQEFLETMHRLTEDIFNESIEELRKPLELSGAEYGNTELNGNRLAGFNLNPSFKSPLHQYADDIKFNAFNKDEDTWVIIVSDVFDDVDVRYDNVLQALEVFDLIMKHQGTKELDNAIDDFLSTSNSPILIGLLLPAVQKVREAAVRLTKLENLVFGNNLLVVAGREQYEQEQRAAAFLGGLDLLVGADFKKQDGNFASIEVLHMIYFNCTAQLWHQAWNEYH